VKKIVIVEDDTDTMEVVEIVLRQAAYAVIKINRQLPIKELSGIKPDLIILDHLLSFGLGSEICLEIKRNMSTKSIPVILFSASQSLAKIASECGADDFIAKPFNLDELLGLVARWVL
jgi:DNA-binding response OmpR family regulator